MTNRLSEASSPYLLQHRHNPVSWQEWGPPALAEARARNVPILLSVGYAACHWCHVMAHESFEDPATAELMNRLFVSIKVDREERPDLDGIYQQALAVLGEQGGWPLTMFLTPTGEPFWGGTYFPPVQRWGRPSFRQVLEHISTVWNEEPEKIDLNRAALIRALRKLATPEGGGTLEPYEAHAAATSIAKAIDPIHGGIGTAPKFPQAPALNLLWQSALVRNDGAMRKQIVHSLRRLCQGGIYDHLGGGFARYSVDATWLVPHFEKMLYDNAQLLELLGEAWIATGDPLFRARADETVGWLQREMRTAGAFAASLDADSEGHEGRFYVWQDAEIDGVLGDGAAAFKVAYDVSAEGNWEGVNILNRLHEAGLPCDSDEAVLAPARAALLAVRATRPRPERDDKLLADWNELMIAALARTGDRMARPDWVTLAEEAFEAIVGHMQSGRKLVHSWRDGRRLEIGFLDDYAQLIRAAMALFEATGQHRYLAQVEAWLAQVDEGFSDGDGALHLAAEADDLVIRPRNAHDGPTPSAVGTIAIESARLMALTGNPTHGRRCENLLRAFAGDARRNAFAHAALFQAALFAARSVQIVVLGDRGDPAWRRLWRVVQEGCVPARVLSSGAASEASLPEHHPLAGKSLVDERPTAYVCRATTCLVPATTPEELVLRLDEALRLGDRAEA